MNKIDEFMIDWRLADSRQIKPAKLSKLKFNLKDFLSIWSAKDSLLDVGCGVGALYEELGRPKKYVGIDISETEIATAKTKFKKGKFEVGNLFDLEYSADIVLCSRVLMHLPYFENAVAKLRAAASRECVLFLPLARKDGCERETSVDQRNSGFTYFRTFSEDTLRKQGQCLIQKHDPYSTVIYG